MVVIRIVLALLAFCISPQTGVFVTITMVTLHIIVKGIEAGVADRKRKDQAKQAQIARETLKLQIQNREEQQVSERLRKQQEREQAMQRRRDQRQAQAQSIIDFYRPYLAEQRKMEKELANRKKIAEQLGKVEEADKLGQKLMRIRKQIFETQLKLEKAEFELDEAI